MPANPISNAAAPICANRASGASDNVGGDEQLGCWTPIHPNYLAYVASQVLPEDTLVVSENFRAADHLMPFGFEKGQWRQIRTFGGSLGYGIGASIGAQLGLQTGQ